MSSTDIFRLPTPPTSTSPPHLVLCADGGGSKVCVVIRSSDGLEVRGTAGPCNVQTVGQSRAAQAILLATYRALSQLPPHLHPNLRIPLLPEPKPISGHHIQTSPPPHMIPLTTPTTPIHSRPGSPSGPQVLPPVGLPIFQYAWLGLAGISTSSDGENFLPFVSTALNIAPSCIKITNDVNLLAAPALDIPNINHVVAVVCGTGTVGSTIRVSHGERGKHLPIEDVAVSRGWGYTLCDEGSAFWIGRLAIRAILSIVDRQASKHIYSTCPPPLLPFHQDLLSYFGTAHPRDLIELVSLTGRWTGIGSSTVDPGEISAKRNAVIAGAARIVLRWAFPDDNIETPPSPATSTSTSSSGSYLNGSLDRGPDDPIVASQVAALKIAKKAIVPLIELTMELLGDQSIVDPRLTVLALGGGLMMSKGYRGLLLDGLKKEGVEWGGIQCIGDAAGVGAVGVARVEFS